MKYKKLPESPDDKCICGHKRKFHKKHGSIPVYCNRILPEELQSSWTNQCGCMKFLDRRHCKIKKTDSILKYLLLYSRHWKNYDDIHNFTGCSIPTISRRCALFVVLELCKKSLVYNWRGYGSYTHHQLNHKIYEELVEEGIIVD